MQRRCMEPRATAGTQLHDAPTLTKDLSLAMLVIFWALMTSCFSLM
jgi:hypothetical protein